jgi:hypothetical protein
MGVEHMSFDTFVKTRVNPRCLHVTLLTDDPGWTSLSREGAS